jgi:hypothetical protein
LDFNLKYNTENDEKLSEKYNKIKLCLDFDIGIIKFKTCYYTKNEIFHLEKKFVNNILIKGNKKIRGEFCKLYKKKSYSL